MLTDGETKNYWKGAGLVDMGLSGRLPDAAAVRGANDRIPPEFRNAVLLGSKKRRGRGKARASKMRSS